MTELLRINTFGEIGYHGSGAPTAEQGVHADFARTASRARVFRTRFRRKFSAASTAVGRLDSGLAMIDASGGVIFLMQWPGGPAMHFFLHELATPTVQKLFLIYRSLYGVPKLLPPRLSFPTRRVQ